MTHFRRFLYPASPLLRYSHMQRVDPIDEIHSRLDKLGAPPSTPAPPSAPADQSLPKLASTQAGAEYRARLTLGVEPANSQGVLLCTPCTVNCVVVCGNARPLSVGRMGVLSARPSKRQTKAKAKAAALHVVTSSGTHRAADAICWSVRPLALCTSV